MILCFWDSIPFRVPGDWLEKLNGQNVTHRDLNDILSSINSREIVSFNIFFYLFFETEGNRGKIQRLFTCFEYQ